MSSHLTRAHLLLEQGRPEQAAEELRHALTQDPDNSKAHALLALCLSDLGEPTAALDEAHAAIRLQPDDPFVHYAHAHVLVDSDNIKDARPAILHAIHLNPQDPDYFSLLGAIDLQRRKWDDALYAADKGLSFEAEHAQCNNIRAIALVNLGRRDEAGQTIQDNLQRDPGNAATHANMGWKLLHDSKPTEAAEHFREALRLEPDNDWARSGIVEALKARNPIYRLMLRYFLWMARLSPAVQWGLIIGAVVGMNVLQQLETKVPALGPLLPFIAIAYIGFVVLSWSAYPLFNLVLRLDTFGKHALSKDQRLAANCLGAALIVIAVLFSVTLWQLGVENILVAAAWGLLILPTSAIFVCKGTPRLAMAVATLGLAGMAGASVASLLTSDQVAQVMSLSLFEIFLWGCVLSTWIAPILASRSR